jgi:hypothetical protein
MKAIGEGRNQALERITADVKPSSSVINGYTPILGSLFATIRSAFSR